MMIAHPSPGPYFSTQNQKRKDVLFVACHHAVDFNPLHFILAFTDLRSQLLPKPQVDAGQLCHPHSSIGAPCVSSTNFACDGVSSSRQEPGPLTCFDYPMHNDLQ